MPPFQADSVSENVGASAFALMSVWLEVDVVSACAGSLGNPDCELTLYESRRLLLSYERMLHVPAHLGLLCLLDIASTRGRTT